MQGTHDVPSAALFTQAVKASNRSLQPSAPFSATLERTKKACSSTLEYLLVVSVYFVFNSIGNSEVKLKNA